MKYQCTVPFVTWVNVEIDANSEDEAKTKAYGCARMELCWHCSRNVNDHPEPSDELQIGVELIEERKS